MQQDSKQLIKGLPRRIALMLLDCGLIVVCYWLAVMLRFDSGDAYRRVEIVRAMAPMLLYVLPIYMIVFWFGGLYEIMWEYAGMRDLARLTCLSGLATGLIMLFDLIYHNRPISGAVLIFRRGVQHRSHCRRPLPVAAGAHGAGCQGQQAGR